MSKKQTVEMQFLTNAKAILGELRLVNAELRNVRHETDRMNRGHTSGAAGAKKHSSAMKGLALRFVGYNLVLNQVMGAQQKFIEFIKESVKAYREFETRIAEINTILSSEHAPILDRLKLGIENLSMAYGQGTSDMSKGMYDILSAAFAAEDALMLLSTATKASIAGLSDIRISVDIFTTVLNTYGMQVEQATSVSNTLFQSVIRGKFQFQDLERALGYVVPIAAQAGIQFQELMAALSTATRHGLHLDMTSRGLALAIQGIINPSVKATKAAKKYGIEMNGLALRVMGLHGWFTKLNEATKEYGKSILGELIPNMRSLRVAMVLAGDVGLEGFSKDLQELAEMGNATEAALKKIMETSQFTANQLTQQWEQVKRNVGEDWDELVLNIQRGLLGVVDFFNRTNYISVAGEKFEFIKDDTLHNATEYLKILGKITDLEEEKATLPLDPIAGEGMPGITGLIQGAMRWIGIIPQLKTPIADLNTDIANLLLTQEDFKEDFMDIVGGIQTETDALGNLELTLTSIELAIRELDDELLKTFVYGFKDVNDEMKKASINIDNLTTLTQEQRNALKKLGSTVQGNLAYQYMALHAQREYADATHDVSMGLKIEDYLYKEIPASIQTAVNAVREHTKAQNDNKEATQRMTAAMRKHQIELLEIQLSGMQRRRGLTRSEEKRIKAIQILQAKARLENMKGQKKMLETDVSTHQTSKTLIDNYLLKIKEKQYELKYTYDQQIIDLETAISREGEKLQTRYDWWETTNQKIITNSQNLITTLNTLMEEDVFVDLLNDYGIKVDELKVKIAALMKTASGGVGTYIEVETPAKSYSQSKEKTEVLKGTPLAKKLSDFKKATAIPFEKILGRLKLPFPIPRYQDGTEYVPETGLAMLHKGEAVIPAGGQSSNGVSINHVTIEVKEIADIKDIEKLGALLSVAQSSRILTNKGKTRYKPR